MRYDFIGRKMQKVKVKLKVAQSCPILCNPMDYTVHGILQARILEWIAVPFSKRSSQPRDQTQARIAGKFFTSWATREKCRNSNQSGSLTPECTIFNTRSKFNVRKFNEEIKKCFRRERLWLELDKQKPLEAKD